MDPNRIRMNATTDDCESELCKDHRRRYPTSMRRLRTRSHTEKPSHHTHLPRRAVPNLRPEAPRTVDSAQKSNRSDQTVSRADHDPLSTGALDQINQHKSIIAEMRPTRRKIKWNQHLTDWERRPCHQQKLMGLQVNDLQGVHIQVTAEPTIRPSQTTVDHQVPKRNGGIDIYEEVIKNPGEHIDEIEQSIEKCLQTIRRVREETKVKEERCQQLQQACNQLRKELLELPAPPRQQTMRQVQQQLESSKKHLMEKQVELDEQIGMLRMQHNRLAADIAMSRELLEEEDKIQAIEYLHESFCLTDNFDDKSHFACGLETTVPPVERSHREGLQRSRTVTSCDSQSHSRPLMSLDECELDLKQRKPATPAAA